MSNSSNIQNGYTLQHIEQYVSGAMTRKQMYDFEKAMDEDLFLADAVEGFMQANQQKAHSDLALIKNDLTKVASNNKKPAFYIQYKAWLQVAAIVIVIACIGLITVSVLQNSHNNTSIAIRSVSKQVDSTTKNDSLKLIPKQQVISADSIASEPFASKKQKSSTDITCYKEAEIYDTSKVSIVNMDIAPKDTAKSHDFKNNRLLSDNKTTIASANIDKALQGKVAGVTTQQTGPAANISNYYGFSNSIDTNRRDLSNAFAKVSKSNTSSSLNEVAVIGFGKSKKKETLTPNKDQKRDPLDSLMPVGGWQYFNDYVHKKVALLYDSVQQKDILITDKYGHILTELELEFSIDQTTGTAYNVKVLSDVDDQKAQSLAEIVQDGPKWTGQKKKGKAKIVIKK